MKAKFGMIVTEGSGKLGGHVASKNRGGAYFRTKVTPANPRTTSQSQVRTRLAEFAQGFRALTSTEIAAWNQAVGNFKKTDIFGDIKNPSGINLYVKLNTNLSEAGQSNITTPPLPAAVNGPATLALTAAEGAGTMSLAYTPTPVPADMTWVVRATPQVSPGVSNVKSRFRNLTTIAAAAASPKNLFASYTAKFGDLIAGQQIFVEVVAVNNLTGQKSPPLVTSCIVAA